MVQEFVSNLLLNIINRIFQNTTHLYYAIGATVVVLVASYFIYKWYFASPAPKKAVVFEEEPVQEEPEQPMPTHIKQEEQPVQEAPETQEEQGEQTGE